MSGAISSTVVSIGGLLCPARPPAVSVVALSRRRPLPHIGGSPYDPHSSVGRTAGERAARAAASARVRTPSLARIRPTWCSAVLGEMYSRAAISAFVPPWRMRSSTSRSRTLSVGHGTVLPVGRAGAHRRAELAQEGRRPVNRRDRAEPLEHCNRGTGFVDRPCRVPGGAQRVGEREASGGGEVRTVSEPLTGTLEMRRRGGVVAGGRGDPAARQLRLSRECVDLGPRREICQPVSGIGCCAEVSERDLGLDQSRRAAPRRGRRRPSSP